jgi:serine/threonine protein kinase
MSAPRDSTPRPKLVTGARPRTENHGGHGPEPTESLHPSSGWAEPGPADGTDSLLPLPASPLGTRDAPASVNTRIDSPGARVRTPARRTAPPPLPKGSERAEDRVGQILGAYRLLELIGKGGMGFVYRAEHARLGREVALKVLRADYAKRRDAVSRFFQEARTVNRIRHRNIVDVTDFVELEDGTTYIIMELLRGKSLGQWARGGAASIDLPRALALLIQICDGLAAAHAVGVIHRDLKPDNIIVVGTNDGAEQIKLLDFGVAKLLNRDDEDIGLETAAGSVIGTPAYMSPEQAGGMVVDHRADIYSLGAIMYELFCGQPLFRGRSFGEYVRKHLNELPMPPRETVGGATIDPRVETMLLRCLEKTADRRFQTVEELRDELLHLLAGIETHEHTLDGRPRMTVLPAPVHNLPLQQPRTPMPGTSPGSTTMPPPVHYSHASVPPGYVSFPGYVSQLPPPAPKRTWLVALVAVAAIGAAVSAVFVAATRQPERTVAPPPPAPATAEVTSVVPSGPGPVAAQPVISVRIDAPNGAQVMAAGAGVVVCAAPCTVTIDPADGGSTIRRDFVVRKAGFVDHPITIDLADPPAAVEVALEPTKEIEMPADSHTRPRVRKSEPEPVIVVAPPPVDEPPPPPPVEEPPKKTRKGSAIDPSKTLDPFAPKK